jgi:hypothetical protein
MTFPPVERYCLGIVLRVKQLEARWHKPTFGIAEITPARMNRVQHVRLANRLEHLQLCPPEFRLVYIGLLT